MPFSERKAAAYLYKLEKQIIELAELTKEITDKIQKLKNKHISKEMTPTIRDKQKELQ